MKTKPIFLVTLLFFVATYYYFFISTLSISQIVGKQSSAQATIILNLFDFDTGLTRYDMYRLAQKSDYWNMRIKQVSLIQDPNRRNVENENLLAEMMEDPVLKKVTRKVLGFGGKASFSILQAILGVAAL
jgi:hypothetical protein